MGGFWRWLKNRLFVPGPSLGNYVLRVWMIQFAGAAVFIAIGSALALTIGDGRQIQIPVQSRGTMIVLLIALGVLTPAVETLMLWGGVELLRLMSRNAVTIALVSGLAWGLVHAYNNNIPNGFANTWAFFCMTAAFQAGAKVSRARGFLLAFTIHAINNTIIVLVVTFASLMENHARWN